MNRIALLAALVFPAMLWQRARAASKAPAVTAHTVLPRDILNVDLEGDGPREKIVLDARRDPALEVWRGGKRLDGNVPRRWKPWKLLTADVDGDGRRDIIVGVYKATRFFKQPHNCVFVYNWDGRRITPKWLGSSLSKRFSDFTFANMDGDRADELIALETRRDGKKCVVVYSWAGFGFAPDWQRGAWTNAKIVSAVENQVLVEADGKRFNVKLLR
jgi:hypothetical protein